VLFLREKGMKHYTEHYEKSDDIYRQAVEYVIKGENLSLAEDMLNTLLLNRPNCFLLIFQLGNVYMKQKYYPIAEIMFLKSLEYHPQFTECMMNLGFVYKEMQMIDEAKAIFKRAVDIVESNHDFDDEEKATYWHNYASTFTANGEPEKAIELCNKAISLDPKKDDSYWNLGLAYLEMGVYEKGFENYEFGKRTAETKNRNYNKDATPFWDGTSGQTVAIYGEQGIGDELMFASMIPDIMKDCNIILDVHPRLQRMFQYMYPKIPVFGTRKMPNIAWASYYPIDAKLSMASLGKFYRKKLEDFPGTPYLKCKPELVEKYQIKLASLGDKKKIGISWKGGTASTSMNQRKIKLKQLFPIFEYKDQVDFISLQYHEDSPIHLEKLRKENGITIHHWQDVLDDYDETAGLVSNLDYIISVPQSVVHLAGALGVPALQLCPKKAMWQMGVYGQNMPWYSCVENIWQDETCKWEPVITEAKEKLCRLLQKNT
jgi:tetratricopeptide (TPR) repeat protein